MEGSSDERAPQVFAPMPTDPRFVDMTGRRFGRLVVLGYAGERNLSKYWWCRCDCGPVKEIKAGHLVAGSTESCGCLLRERHRTHGKARTAIYHVWQAMRQRCENPHGTHYAYYGGRGIAVCERWQSFENFYTDMGEPPFPGAELDRYPDQDGDYRAGNVRWATRAQQLRNLRRNRMFEYNGETLCATDWGARIGVKGQTITNRIEAGWPLERALTEPSCRPRVVSSPPSEGHARETNRGAGIPPTRG